LEFNSVPGDENAAKEKWKVKNRYQLFGLLALVAAMALSACAPFGGAGQKTIHVGPYLVDCTGVAPQKCMLVREDPKDDWTYFYDQIQGFDYEPGFEYELVIREDRIENPPADASSLQWTLVEVVSKERSLEGTTWVLVSYKNSAGEMVEVLADGEVTAVFQDGHLGGSAGCNSYFGRYTLDGSKISVTVGGSTMMSCAPPELMDQEQAYLSALSQAGFWVVQGDELRLAGADGKPLLNYAVLQPTALMDTNWQLTGYNNGRGGFASTIAGTEITANFGDDGTMGGSAGCNQYSAPYEISGATPTGGSISFGMVATTMMMCGEPEGIMEQEQAYLAALESVTSYEIEGDQLNLYDQQGTRMAAYTVQPSTALVATQWEVMGYNDGKGGYTSVLLDTQLTAFFGEDGSLTGSAGCNNYTTTYQVEDSHADGGAISIGPAATTRMMCAEPEGIMDQEQAYLAAVQSAASYAIEGDQLELRDPEGTRMVTFAAQPEGEAGAAPAPPVGGAGPSEQALANMAYKSDFTESGKAPLSDGEYREQAAPGSATETVVKLSEQAAYGELNGQPAATVVLITDPGGSGTFYSLAVVVEQDGQPVNLASTPLGDRVQINSLVIENGQIVVDMVTQGPDDAMCCPTQRVVRTFALQGDQLVQSSSETLDQTRAEGAGGSGDLVGPAWQWTGFSDPVEGPQAIADPAQYTVEFLTDGQVKIKADCNHASGTYTAEDSSILIEIGPMTMAHCGPDSVSDEFIYALGNARIYFFEGEDLYLDLFADSGTMRFGKAK
jgi:heat shock protein HslJ